VNATPWHVAFPLNLKPTNTLLPKFKYHFPKFSVGGTITVNEDLIDFSYSYYNISSNDNDSCMLMFMDFLEKKVPTDFYEIPPKDFST